MLKGHRLRNARLLIFKRIIETNLDLDVGQKVPVNTASDIKVEELPNFDNTSVGVVL